MLYKQRQKTIRWKEETITEVKIKSIMRDQNVGVSDVVWTGRHWSEELSGLGRVLGVKLCSASISKEWKEG